MYKVLIDDDEVEFDLTGEEPKFGPDEVLASREMDILGKTSWYQEGYTVARLFSDEEMGRLKRSVTARVGGVLAAKGIADLGDFTLERYHEYVRSDAMHRSVIEVTRELTMADIDFEFEAFVRRVSETIGHPLKSTNDILRRSFLIVRINRPRSLDYNPPHKDGYLPLWQRTVNLWVPIAGVNAHSSLPMVAGSHLLSESVIKRTTGGAVLNGMPYRVPAIVEWDGHRKMVRPTVKEGEALVFSPLIIHGCAKNLQSDVTRVALELRLSSAVAA